MANSVAWKKAHPDRVRWINRESDRRKYWADPESGRARGAAKYQANPEATKNRLKATPIEWRRAHWVVKALVRSGRLMKPDKCELCHESGRRIEAHHEDYKDPKRVQWLCSRCHGRTRRIA